MFAYIYYMQTLNCSLPEKLLEWSNLNYAFCHCLRKQFQDL